MSETTINKKQFEDMGLKGQLSVLYDNTEETKTHVRCLARKKEKLNWLILKRALAASVVVYVVFQAIPLDAATAKSLIIAALKCLGG